MNPDYSSALAWLLSISFCLILSLHIIENKKLKIYLQQQCKPEPAKQILRLSWSRTIQLLAVMASSFALIMLYNQQANDKQEQVTSFENLIIRRNYSNVHADKAAKAMPDHYQNPMNKNMDKAINAPIERPSQLNRENIIQDIFGTETDPSDLQNPIDDIKSRYEELIVTYMIMQKCNRAEASDYQLIMAALQKEIIAAQAPERLQYDILTAAKGSYEELYSGNDCQKPDIDAAAAQYKAYINNLANTNKPQQNPPIH